MRQLLVIAYYFPPMGLSGVQRVARMVRYLPEHGWHPVVLTVEPQGYFAYDPSLLHEVEAAGVEIHRTQSLDPTRLFGKGQTVAMPAEGKRRRWSLLSQLLFVPDNKVGWYPWAVRAGRRLLAARRFDAVFATVPPYTAALVGRSLSRWSGLPLVLDFRDDWLGNPRHVYPTAAHRWAHRWLERRALLGSRGVTTINEPIRQSLRRRIGGDQPPVTVVPQGFDPADFAGDLPRAPGDRMRLLYSGIFYDAQTPDYLLRALARFIERRPEARATVEAVFVGHVPDPSRSLAEALGLSDVVRYAGYVPHDEAVAALRTADVLWMTVGRRAGAEGISTSKLFEYMGARKPILALVPDGAARAALAPYGAAVVVPPDGVEEIAAALERLWEGWRAGALPVPDESYVSQFDRRRLAGAWARLLDESVIAI